MFAFVKPIVTSSYSYLLTFAFLRGIVDSWRLDNLWKFYKEDHANSGFDSFVKLQWENLRFLIKCAIIEVILHGLLYLASSYWNKGSYGPSVLYAALIAVPIVLLLFEQVALSIRNFGNRSKFVAYLSQKHNKIGKDGVRKGQSEDFSTILTHFMFILSFLLFSFLTKFVPGGFYFQFFYNALGYSFAVYDDNWSFLQHWSTDDRKKEFQRKWLYMFGFGFSVNLIITFFCPALIGIGLWALLQPVFLILSIQSDPIECDNGYFPRKVGVFYESDILLNQINKLKIWDTSIKKALDWWLNRTLSSYNIKDETSAKKDN